MDGTEVNTEFSDFGPTPLKPDPEHFAVTKSPVLVLTGTEDTLQSPGSAWADFKILATPERGALPRNFNRRPEPRHKKAGSPRGHPGIQGPEAGSDRVNLSQSYRSLLPGSFFRSLLRCDFYECSVKTL